MEGVTRIDDTPQHKAVREAMTNAVIHSDFMLNGLLRVEKYDDRFVLTNPGLLKIPVEQIYEGGETRARNPAMQAMLRMIGYGENLGSGFPLILSAWHERHWLQPELIEHPDLLQVKLVLRIIDEKGYSFRSNDSMNGSENKKNDRKDDRKELSERQKVIVEILKSDDRITISRMTELLDASEKTIRRDINDLKKIGILSREGGRKDGRWILS